MSDYVEAYAFMKNNALVHKTIDERFEKEKGNAGGVATLDSDGKVPVSQIPDYLEAGDGVSVDFNKISLNVEAGRGVAIGRGEGTQLVVSSTLDVDVFKVADSLPERPAEGCESKIYVVKASETEGNEYEEYIWNAEEGAWEELGAFQVDLDTINKAIADEAAAREAADAALTEGLSSTGEELRRSIEDEEAAREAGDAALNTALEGEKAERKAQDGVLQDEIDALEGSSSEADASLQSAIDAEAARAAAAEAALQSAIEAEEARAVSVEGLKTDLTTDAKATLVSAINEVDANGDANAAAIAAETERAEAAEASLGSSVSSEAEARMEADNDIKELLSQGDASLRSAISSEKERAQVAEASLQTAIDGEASSRESADTEIMAGLSEEVSRATEKEAELSSSISSEAERAKAAEEELAAALEEADGTLDSVTVEEVTEGLSTNVLKEYVLKVGGAQRGAAIDIYKDSSVSDVHIGDESAGEDPQRLYITYIKADGTTETVNVDFSSFVAEAEMGDGLQVSDHKVGVKLDGSGEAFLTVGGDGLKLSGVQDAIDAAIDAIDAALFTDSNHAIYGVQQVDGKIKTLYSTDTVQKAEQLKTAKTIGIADANGDHEGAGASFDGTVDVTLKLPSTICADLVGDVEGTATSATSAGSATNDSEGNKISETYVSTVATDGDGAFVTSVTKSKDVVTVTKQDAGGVLKAGDNVSISGNTISATDTTYSAATSSAAGLMSASDKKKLDGVAEGADSVSVTQTLTSGTEIGKVAVTSASGTATTTFYAPTYTDTGMTSVATSGSGNVVSGASYDASTRQLTLTKGVTALTSHQSVTADNPTLAWGATSTVGNVGGTELTVTMPSNPNTDTKNTAGSTDSSSKLYLIGATSQAASPQTYSHDTAYVGTDGCLYSGGSKVVTSSNYTSVVTKLGTSTVGSSSTPVYLDAGTPKACTVDAAVSTSSENPVQNKVITSYVHGIFSYDEDTKTLTITV